MVQKSLILNIDLIPPLIPTQKALTDIALQSVFTQESPDYQLFKAKTNSSLAPFLTNLIQFITDQKSTFCFGIHVSGTTLAWLDKHIAGIGKLLDKLNASGKVEWITGPYDHSLRFGYDRDEMDRQVLKMGAFIEKRFKQKPQGFTLPFQMYNTYLGYHARKLEVDYILVPPEDDRTISQPPHNPYVRLLHCQNWKPEGAHLPGALVVNWSDLEQNKTENTFFDWLKKFYQKTEWVLPRNLGNDQTWPGWDIQNLITGSETIGREWNGTDHPICKSWLSLLEEGNIPNIDGLHHAGIILALMGKISEVDAVQVYRTLMILVRRKDLGKADV